MLDIMYEIPKDDNIGRVTITKNYIEGTGGPAIQIRGAGYAIGISRLRRQNNRRQHRNSNGGEIISGGITDCGKSMYAGRASDIH